MRVESEKTNDPRIAKKPEQIEGRVSGKAPFGQLPLLEVDGTVLAQSFSIMRYVANEVGLAPSTNLQKAQADMIVDGCTDLAELVEQAKAATPTHLKFLEDILATNNGGKGFFVGDKLSHADIAMFNLLNYAFAHGKQVVPDEVKHFPLLAGHCARIMNIPNIKKWLEERPETAM
ncbi:hypothetical protein OS493_030917 [Desmophyllum pertusum]|uniref:Glutathione S-transferase n=1 Tax=Desmophyllum pertusum TaxID=174260 RepID=A0A9X0D6S7_9CNID|nr:hypothetical protein OS493_030917 [Desmophyllum pertusum]